MATAACANSSSRGCMGSRVEEQLRQLEGLESQAWSSSDGSNVYLQAEAFFTLRM